MRGKMKRNGMETWMRAEMRKEAQRGRGCRKRSDLDDSSRPDESRQLASTPETWSDASGETHHHELKREKNTGTN